MSEFARDIPHIHEWFEYDRIYSYVMVTDRGLYKEDQQPDDYGGTILKVEVVHAITMVDRAGRLNRMYFGIMDEPFDKFDLTGGDIIIDNDLYRSGSGPSAVTWNWYKRTQIGKLNDIVRNKGSRNAQRLEPIFSPAFEAKE